MKVVPLFCFNSLRNFSYLVICNQKVVCIDPFEAKIVLNYLNKHDLKLSAILNTHGHHDHIRGNEILASKTKATIVNLCDGEDFSFSLEQKLVAFATPGHTMDHQCFLGFEGKNIKFVFVGDTLFNAGVGNCKNGGDKPTLYQSVLKMIKSFPDSAVIYPGHDYFQNNLKFAKSIGKLNNKQQEYFLKDIKAENGNFPFLPFGQIKEINPFLQISSEEEFLKLRTLRDSW